MANIEKSIDVEVPVTAAEGPLTTSIGWEVSTN